MAAHSVSNNKKTSLAINKIKIFILFALISDIRLCKVFHTHYYMI